MRQATPGAVSRTTAWWQTGPLADREYQRHGAGPKFRYLYEVDGVAEGYAMYRVTDDWDHRGPKSRLDVVEAVTVTPRAIRDVWRFLFEIDLVRTVRARRVAVPNPLQHLLAEPRALGLVAGDGLWLRLVDLPAALAARCYASADSLVLEVTDDFCPWNAGRWRLETGVDAGGAVVADCTADVAAPAAASRTLDVVGGIHPGGPWAGRVTPTDGEPDLVLDTTDLAAVYLGDVRPSELAVAGRVEERTPGALRRADALFAADRRPWCVSMF